MKLFTLIMSISLTLNANTVKIAVLDTGLKLNKFSSVSLCKGLSKDFTGKGIHDTDGHGTNVAGLISSNSKIKHCLIIIKVFGGVDNLEDSIKGLKYAATLSPDIINISYGGLMYSAREYALIMKFLKDGVHVVAAAGNLGTNLNKKCKYYPACYDKRVHVVGNIGSNSNYGKKVVDIVLDGNNKKALGITLSGSSQSTAVFSGVLSNKIRRGTSSEQEQAVAAVVRGLLGQPSVGRVIKRVEDKYVSEEVKKYGGAISATAKIITEKKITYKWSF